ncbi:MAG: hypothetical protein NTV32_07125 [Gammaproteobacteria bacterium]|nr:hypothetical protein [Gammaproteobacteria bacterium]
MNSTETTFETNSELELFSSSKASDTLNFMRGSCIDFCDRYARFLPLVGAGFFATFFGFIGWHGSRYIEDKFGIHEQGFLTFSAVTATSYYFLFMEFMLSELDIKPEKWKQSALLLTVIIGALPYGPPGYDEAISRGYSSSFATAVGVINYLGRALAVAHTLKRLPANLNAIHKDIKEIGFSNYKNALRLFSVLPTAMIVALANGDTDYKAEKRIISSFTEQPAAEWGLFLGSAIGILGIFGLTLDVMYRGVKKLTTDPVEPLRRFLNGCAFLFGFLGAPGMIATVAANIYGPLTSELFPDDQVRLDILAANVVWFTGAMNFLLLNRVFGLCVDYCVKRNARVQDLEGMPEGLENGFAFSFSTSMPAPNPEPSQAGLARVV